VIGWPGQWKVDEAYLGGLEEGVRGRGIEKKALIVVAAQEMDEVSAAFACSGFPMPRPGV